MLTLNHTEMLQRVCKCAVGISAEIWAGISVRFWAGSRTPIAAGIVLLSFASGNAWGAPRSDFDAPISSHECRTRLQKFGASDAGIELATPAIEAYVKLILQRTPSTLTNPFLPVPLDLSTATEMQNRIARELADCDATDTQLTAGILSVMRGDSDRQAAERFQRWVDTRRDQLFFRSTQLRTIPLDFSVRAAVLALTVDESIRTELVPQLSEHEALMARLSRAARSALLGTPLRTARLAQERSIAPTMNPEVNSENYNEWKLAAEQVRTDGLGLTLEAFGKIGAAQRSIVEQISQRMNPQAAWDLRMNLYEMAYPKPIWDRVGVEAATKALRRLPGVDPKSLIALDGLEQKWRTESLSALASLAKLHDDRGWIPTVKPEDIGKSQNNEQDSRLNDLAKSFRDQISALKALKPETEQSSPSMTMGLTDDEMAEMMKASFGSLCSASPIKLTELTRILDATEAAADQRGLALIVRQDSSETFLRMNDGFANRWADIGARTVGSPENSSGPPSPAIFDEIARIRQDQHEADRTTSEQFFSQLSSIISTAPKGGVLETYRLAHLRMIERDFAMCMTAQTHGIHIEPLWRVDFETIANATNHPESEERNRATMWALIHSRNKELLPAMRMLSDGLLALLAANQLMSAIEIDSGSAPAIFTGRSIEDEAANPRALSNMEIRDERLEKAVALCLDASKRIALIQNATLAEIISTLPPNDVDEFVTVVRRTAYPTLAKFLGTGDRWIIRALALTETDDVRIQGIISLASAYGPASEALFHTAVEQQSILDTADARTPSANETLRRTFFARQELDAALLRDIERVLGPDLAARLKESPKAKPNDKPTGKPDDSAAQPGGRDAAGTGKNP